jgi:hypothetical protein
MKRVEHSADVPLPPRAKRVVEVVLAKTSTCLFPSSHAPLRVAGRGQGWGAVPHAHRKRTAPSLAHEHHAGT